MSARHPAGQQHEPAGQHPQQRHGRVQPDRQRHLCRRHVGHRRPDPAGRRHADPDRHQHLHRRRPRSTPARSSVNGSLTSTVTVGAGGTLGGNGTIGGAGHQRRHAGARQLDRHADRQRQLRAERGQHLSGRGQRRGPERPHQRHGRHGHHQRRHGAGAGRSPAATRTSTTYTILNATGGVTGTYSGVTSNFAFLTPSLQLRRQQRVPDAGAAARAPSAASARRRPTSRPSAPRSTSPIATATRRLRHGARRAGRPQHRAGPGGAERRSAASPMPTSAP